MKFRHNSTSKIILPTFAVALVLALVVLNSVFCLDTRNTESFEFPKPTKKKNFTELLIKSGSDKYSKHHYERYYERWLAPYQEKKGLKFLEIGAHEGNSLKLWSSYFVNDPEAIVGLAYGSEEYDIVPAGKFVNGDTPGETVLVIQGDQSKAKTMSRLGDLGPWDVIIDDGSHFPAHVIFSLFSLWPIIKPGGIYVIEDIETSYWAGRHGVYGHKLKNSGFQSDAKHSVVYKLKEVLDVLARFQLGLDSSDLSVMPNDEDLCSVEWGMNVVALRKCGPDDGPNPPKNPSKPFNAADLDAWLHKVRNSNPKLVAST